MSEYLADEDPFCIRDFELESLIVAKVGDRIVGALLVASEMDTVVYWDW
jgi:hypothetical protein